jgi:2-desacetyl-2-hydroxyethyl bacteriochlorophyllide A dehydrogenase
MQAFVLHGPEELQLQERHAGDLGAGDVRIAIRRAGICGSDIHYYRHFQIGQFVPRGPLVLGHEFSGVVVERGRDVTNVAIGDPVTAEPSIECQTCRYCRQGRYNLCERLRFLGTAATVPHIDGAFAEQVVVPARNCYILDKEVDFAIGALVEPLAVGAHAVQRVGSVAGARILVTGGGTIGQTVLAAARAWGATDITVADPQEFSREFSRDHGARQVLDPREDGLAEHLFRNGGYDIVFEASGSPAALEFAYAVTAPGGSIVQVGTQPATVSLPANLIMSREITLYGSFRYAHVYPLILGWIRAGTIDVRDFVTHVFPFDQFPQAMKCAVARDGVIKVQIEHR